jgi:valyl-tRNA synthetase
MTGRPVRWTPGSDHAGIATQMVVQKWAHNRLHRPLTREEFLTEAREWRADREREIRSQLLRLGASLDFGRQYYTLSDDMSAAVTEAFVRLHRSGHIYRRSAPVNWSYFMRSTLSDIEVEHREVDGPTRLSVPGYDGQVLVGVMHRFNYPLDGTDPSAVIPVATTRLETIVGDVAIAVHPEDSRYQHVVGRHAVHPFTGRRMPIVADRAVRPELGTGAVKITPAHSVFDYALAERHSLPALDVFDSEGRLHCLDAPEFTGLHRFEAKDVVRRALESRGLYVSCEPHRQSIPVCHRSGDLIESRLLSQWFLKCDKQREMSVPDERQWREFSQTVAPEDRHLSIVPPNYRNVWKDWFSRWEDWCISRQIYWGHRIPAYNVIIDGMPTDDWIAAKRYDIPVHPYHQK